MINNILFVLPRNYGRVENGFTIIVDNITSKLDFGTNCWYNIIDEQIEKFQLGKENLVKSISSTSKSPSYLNHLSFKPISLIEVNENREKVLSSFLKETGISKIVFWGSRLGGIADYCSNHLPSSISIIFYSVDNMVVNNLMLSKSTANLFGKISSLLQSKKWDAFYKKIRVDYIVFVSQKEAYEYEKKYFPDYKVVVIPNGVSFSKPEIISNKEYDFVFTGNFKYPPNKDGIYHFMRKIWPKIIRIRPNVRLAIVGRGIDPKICAFLSKQPNVIIVGEVKSILNEIEKARVLLFPVRYGSGIRNNILQALFMEIPIVTYEINIEGIPGAEEYVYSVKSVSEFISQALVLLKKKSIASSRYLIESEYTWDLSAKKLSKLLEL